MLNGQDIIDYGLKNMKPHPDSNFVPSGSHAWTIGRHVFIRKGYSIDQALIQHEAVHVYQYNREGMLKFLAIYAYDYIKNFIKYGEHRKAYNNVRFEKEAHEIVNSIN